MAIDILYEDKHLVALNKPTGQIVIPGRGGKEEVPLAKELERHLGRRVYVVHRLDRGASGVILFAKDARTHRDLNQQFELRAVKKTYLVCVQGCVEKDGQVAAPLREYGSGRMGVHVQGKPSRTDYRVKKSSSTATLLEVSPHTGRRHQIRVHLYSIGHPVLGDRVYGKERPVGGASRLMLHAWKIEFLKLNGERLCVEAPPPDNFLV